MTFNDKGEFVRKGPAPQPKVAYTPAPVALQAPAQASSNGILIFVACLLGGMILWLMAHQNAPSTAPASTSNPSTVQKSVSEARPAAPPVVEKTVIVPGPAVTVTRTPPPVEEEKPRSASSGAYLLPASATRELAESDLQGLDKRQLTLARNEIYARHGRLFNDAELRHYFEAQSWYNVNDSYSDSDLSSVETANARFIKNYQDANGLNW